MDYENLYENIYERRRRTLFFIFKHINHCHIKAKLLNHKINNGCYFKWVYLYFIVLSWGNSIKKILYVKKF